MMESDTGPSHSRNTSAGRLWASALLGGLIAAGLSWGAGETSVNAFRAKEVGDPLKETIDLPGINRVIVQNASLAHGLQGALLGLTLGIAGGLARRPPRVSVVPSLVGLATGGVLGAATSYGVFTAFHTLTDANSSELIPSLLAHGGLAALVGASGGLAFGLASEGWGRAGRCAIGGMAGAVLGAVLFEVVGAVVFPVAKTGDPIAAEGSARLLWHALVNLLAALGAAAVAEAPAKVTKSTPTPAPTGP